MTEYVMTYSGPQLMLDTAVGTVQVTFTDAGHAYVGANGSGGNDPGDVVFARARWYVSVHLYAATGWTEDSGDPGQGNHRHQFTEAGTFGGRVITAPRRAKIMEALTAAVREYAEAHPGTLQAAELNHVSHELENAEKAEREAYATWQAAAEKAGALTAKWAELTEKWAELSQPASPGPGACVMIAGKCGKPDHKHGQAVAHGQAIRQSAGDAGWHGGA